MDDYFFGSLERFARALARLLHGQDDDATFTMVDLEALAHDYLGLSMEMLRSFSPELLLQMFQHDVSKLYIVGRLLEQDVRLHEARNERLARASADKALYVLEMVQTEYGDFLNDEHKKAMQSLHDYDSRKFLRLP